MRVVKVNKGSGIMREVKSLQFNIVMSVY